MPSFLPTMHSRRRRSHAAKEYVTNTEIWGIHSTGPMTSIKKAVQPNKLLLKRRPWDEETVKMKVKNDFSSLWCRLWLSTICRLRSSVVGYCVNFDLKGPLFRFFSFSTHSVINNCHDSSRETRRPHNRQVQQCRSYVGNKSIGRVNESVHRSVYRFIGSVGWSAYSVGVSIFRPIDRPLDQMTALERHAMPCFETSIKSVEGFADPFARHL